MANDLKQHKRLVEETEVCNERDVEVELERAASPGCPDPMAEQSMVGNTLPQPVYVEERTFCCGLCCFKGCVLGAVGMLFMFIILPTGVLLVFHGVNKRSSMTLNIGVGLLCIPTLLFIITIILCKYCYVTRKDKHAEIVVKRRTLAFENLLSKQRSSKSFCSSTC